MMLRRLAIAWLLEKDWPRWLAIDPGFQPDFNYWQERMQTTFARLKAAGVNVVKVEIDPNEFAEWTRATGRSIGSDSRAAFASMKAMQQEFH